MNYLSGIVLGATDRQHIYFYCTAVGVGVNIILNLILIPEFSHAGAGAATLITQAIMVLVYGTLIVKLFRIRVDQKYIFKVIFSCVVMGGIVYCTRSVPLPVSFGIGLFTYPFLLFVFKAFSNQELVFLRNELQIK